MRVPMMRTHRGSSNAAHDERPVVRRRFAVTTLGQIVLVAVAMVALVLPSATFALVPAEFDAAVGESGTTAIKSTVTHSNAQTQDGAEVNPSREPAWGDYFTYTYTWEATNLNEAGTVQQPLELHVNFSAGAKPTSEVTSSDFTLPAGWTVEVTKESDTGYTAKVTPASGATSGTISVKKQASIPAKGEPGAPADAATLWASSSAKTSATPNISLTEGEYFFVGDNGTKVDCSGVFQFQWKVNAGAWLADIKFGDAAGRGKIVLDDAALVAGDGPNSIKVTDVNGNDITAEVVEKMTWNKADSSEPYQPNPFGARYPNMKWLQSANWKIDTSTFTGDTWLPAGSTVTVKKHGRHENCVAGIATDWQTSRPLEALMEVTRPVMDTNSNAVDPIQLPGTPAEDEPAWCQKDLFYHDRSRNQQREWGRITLDGQDHAAIKAIDLTKTPRSTTTTSTISAFYSSVAASDKFPNKVYFIGGATSGANAGFQGLIEYDRSTKTYRAVAGGSPSPRADGQTVAIGFDNHGRIWLVNGSHVGTGSAVLANDIEVWMIDLTKSNPQWKETHTISTMGLGNYEPLDIAFDAWDNVYVTTSSHTQDGQGKIVRWEKSEWDAAAASRGSVDVGEGNQPKNWNRSMYASDLIYETAGKTDYEKVVATVNVGGGMNWKGLAFGPDGNLYLGQEGKRLYRVDLINHDTGQLLPENQRMVHGIEITSRETILAPVQSGNVYSANDLAGCYFGKLAEQPKEPKFQVQKSVIDPVTGAVVEPGKAASNTVSIDNARNVTVDYVVSVSNVGAVAGTPSTITDTLTVPDGFTITEVLVDGQAQGASGSFTLTPGELPAGGIQTYRVTLKLKADVDNVNWTAAETCGAMSGEYGGGFYNAVTMEGDSDGPENNYACVPTTPSAQIALKKFINTPMGGPVSGSDPLRLDAQYFTLGASLVGGGVQKTGQSAESGKYAVNSTVPAGTYQLFEVPNDNGEHTGKYEWGSQWYCVDTTTTDHVEVPVNEDNQVVVKPGQCVTCEIHNQPPTLVHIEKFPYDSVGTNPHIGSAITPDAAGKFEAKYQIVVTNTSSFMINTGAIRDHFEVPAGLVWDPDKAHATVDYEMQTYAAGSMPRLANPGTGFPKKFTQAELASDEGALITDSIQQLDKGQTVTFIVTIPLQLDNTAAEGGKTNAQTHMQELGECESLTTKSAKHTSRKQGIANAVDLDNEDLTYNQIPILDNIACVPVVVPPPPPPVIPELPALPLTGGGSARDLFVLGGLALTAVGGASLLIRQIRIRRAAALAEARTVGRPH